MKPVLGWSKVGAAALTILVVVPAISCRTISSAQSYTDRDIDWEAYGHDGLGSRFSPATAITPDNVGSLTVAWTYRTGEMQPAFATKRDKEFETTPIVVDGTMYIDTPLGRVIALDPATGTERWVFDPHVDRSIDLGDFASRGVSS